MPAAAASATAGPLQYSGQFRVYGYAAYPFIATLNDPAQLAAGNGSSSRSSWSAAI